MPVDTDNLRELALRVVTKAIQDAQHRGPILKGLRQLTGYQAPRCAELWMRETADDDDPGTFGWWCTVLDLDPAIILERLHTRINTSHIHFIR